MGMQSRRYGSPFDQHAGLDVLPECVPGQIGAAHEGDLAIGDGNLGMDPAADVGLRRPQSRSALWSSVRAA